MIIYATKQTFERYKIVEPQNLSDPIKRELAEQIIQQEATDPLLDWGAKIFYFDRRKCLQLSNFASKFTLFLFDIKLADMDDLGSFIVTYLLRLYDSDTQMIAALHKMFEASPVVVFDRLKNRSAIATLNLAQREVVDEKYDLYDFFEGNVLNTLKINHFVNFRRLVTIKLNDKRKYIYPGERFRKLLVERYR
ncbi:hypothetical protein [Lactobacillus sp. ESL0681]|uniref:DUF6933 domain-containing protein n=1 Tax=Lactobacillus sp. ESL0681 TaxID=2983211 RepID=UPI0023F7FA49|nr:hypothetical protein [Lactobacillus sp. ESL0681]WEV40292.1 hypothetical protein OZX59_08995 [Lactobacillus sp. ESL0681]